MLAIILLHQELFSQHASIYIRDQISVLVEEVCSFLYLRDQSIYGNDHASDWRVIISLYILDLYPSH